MLLTREEAALCEAARAGESKPRLKKLRARMEIRAAKHPVDVEKSLERIKRTGIRGLDSETLDFEIRAFRARYL